MSLKFSPLVFGGFVPTGASSSVTAKAGGGLEVSGTEVGVAPEGITNAMVAAAAALAESKLSLPGVIKTTGEGVITGHLTVSAGVLSEGEVVGTAGVFSGHVETPAIIGLETLVASKYLKAASLITTPEGAKTLTGALNDLAVTTGVIQQTGTGEPTISGFTDTGATTIGPGAELEYFNLGTKATFLIHESTLSKAENRIFVPGKAVNETLEIAPGHSVVMRYIKSRWHVKM